MKLKKFIKQLKMIEKNSGSDVEVVMADAISVVRPIFLSKYKTKEAVIITDKEHKF